MTANNVKTVIIAISVVAVAIIIYLMVKGNNPQRMDEQEAVSCGNKTVYRYKYPSEAFPMFARDYNTEVSLTSDVLKRFSDSLGNGQVSVDTKNKVIDLQEKLNQDNITFSTALRSYFININADPCNDTLRQKYLAFTDEMTRRMLELRNTTAQVTTIAQNIIPPNVDNKATTSGTKDQPIDTTIKQPKYAIVKDTTAIKKSLNKLDVFLQSNNSFNRKIIPVALKVK